MNRSIPGGVATSARLLVPVFVLLFLAGTLGRDVRRPLWHDEIFTLYIATRTGAEGLWAALATGVDLQPPLYYLAVRGLAAWLGPGELATRLPSTLGFLAACLALYVFMRRRVDPLFAIVAPLALTLTTAFMYSYEGRPYGLLLGLSAIALAAWQARGENGSRRIALIVCGLALAATVFTHYYGVLMVLPLAAGELARVAVRRRFDWALWIAFAAATAVPLMVLRPLFQGARQVGARFWSPPTLDLLTTFYRELPDPLSLFLVIAAGCMALAALWSSRGGQLDTASAAATTGEARLVPLEEIVAALALVVLPAGAYILAMYTGAFHGRYVIQAALGVAIVVAWSCATLVRVRRNAVILLGVLSLGFAGRQAGGALGLVRGLRDPLAEHRPLLAKAGGGAPLVVSSVLDFLPMAHYSDAQAGEGLVYLTGRAELTQGPATGDSAIRLLANYRPLDVQDLNTFLQSHRRFHVYGRPSWLIPHLLSRGASVRLLGSGENAALYAIDTPN